MTADALVLHGERRRLGPACALAQRDWLGLDDRRRVDRADDVEHAGALAEPVVQEAEAALPDQFFGSALFCSRAVMRLRVQLRPGLEYQRHAAGDVRRRHGGARQRGGAAQLQRIGREDVASRRAEVGLEAQSGVRPNELKPEIRPPVPNGKLT